MKYIILAALIATALSLTCPSTKYFKGTQKCFYNSECATMSDARACATCPLGSAIDPNDNEDCDSTTQLDVYTKFYQLTYSESNKCLTLMNYGTDDVTDTNYNTVSGCVVSGTLVCNGCATAATGSVGTYPLNGKCLGNCSTKCLACTDDSNCTKCDQKYGLVSNACTICTVTSTGAECLNCDGDVTICKLCSDNYGIVSNKCEQCNDTNCKNCDGAVATCKVCKAGWYLDAGECKDCNADATVSDVATCSGDAKGTPLVISKIDTCATDMFLTDKGCLAALKTNCLEIDSTTKFCTKCYNSNWYLHNDACVQANDISTGCITGTSGATGAAATCTACGTFKDADTPYTGTTYAYVLNGTSCTACGAYCKTCTTTACTACINEEEYHKNDDTTWTSCIPCSTTTPGAKKCQNVAAGTPTECIGTQKPFSGNASCNDACNTGCKTCLADGTCDSCPDGKYLLSGACADCLDANCAKCGTDGKCLECNNKRARDTSASTCGTSDMTGCYESDGTDDKCTTCLFGYKNVSGVCKACSTTEVCAKTPCPALTGGSPIGGNASVLAFCSTLLLAVLAFLF